METIKKIGTTNKKMQTWQQNDLNGVKKATRKG